MLQLGFGYCHPGSHQSRRQLPVGRLLSCCYSDEVVTALGKALWAYGGLPTGKGVSNSVSAWPELPELPELQTLTPSHGVVVVHVSSSVLGGVGALVRDGVLLLSLSRRTISLDFKHDGLQPAVRLPLPELAVLLTWYSNI